ncbi:MAG: hypothetical protein LBR52_03120 [Prevotellaceae bacterium]|jgi:hypothetical protein|nr:hypothetical protein [Prevotellaceae bacterium]
MDFTLKIYKQLLTAFQQAGYQFLTFQQFCEGRAGEKFVILRHDVDLKAGNSLVTAKIEYELGIKATYYFRIIPQSNKPHIIREIAKLGHEIGYHYEDLSLFNGDAEKAIAHFKEQLACFRQYYPVKTICMHGSPGSRIDNRTIWKQYDYRDFEIIGEPYIDLNFNEIYYLTDTGRSWNGEKYSVRDKVQSTFDCRFQATQDIIKAIQTGAIPKKIMIAAHPQRWTDNCLEWTWEFLFQRIKNKIKYFYK